MLRNSNPLPTVSREPPSTALFWDRHPPRPSLTLVKLQPSHFLNQNGIKRVLCTIAIHLSFVMNAFVYIHSFFKPACFAKGSVEQPATSKRSTFSAFSSIILGN